MFACKAASLASAFGTHHFPPPGAGAGPGFVDGAGPGFVDGAGPGFTGAIFCIMARN